MRGVLLDPRTGRPEDLATRHRDLAQRHALNGADRVRLAQILGADEIAPALPAHIAENLVRARSELGRSIVGSLQSWEEALYVNIVSGSNMLITGTAEALLHPDPALTVPAFYMQTGRALQLRYWGEVGTDASAGNVTFRLRWGGLTGTVIVASANVALTNSVSNITLSAEWVVISRAHGNSATSLTLHGVGRLMAPGAGQTLAMMPASSIADVASLDGTTSKALSATAQFDNTGNSLQGEDYILESLN